MAQEPDLLELTALVERLQAENARLRAYIFRLRSARRALLDLAVRGHRPPATPVPWRRPRRQP